MRPDDVLIDELAEAVLDGSLVDWATAESRTARGAQRLRHLETVARLADVHRRGAADLDMWGHIRIVERIGRGAFGDVYRGFDTRLEREVALKLIPADSATSSVIDEGRLLARVQHVNVVTIHGADRLSGYVGLWMELVRGQTLEQWLKTRGPIDPDQVARIGVEVSRALAAVHAAGLLHRDIKAHNVMRTDEGRIVLMDFGAGREAGRHGSDMTGTPLYLAPELFQEQPATAQTDVYSVGVLLYRLLTASYPVQGQTIDEVRQAHRSRARDDVRGVRAEVPSRLARVIARAINVEPARRHATADDLCADLERALQSSRRRRRLSSAAAVVAIVPIPFMFAQRAGWLPSSPIVDATLARTFGASPRAVLPAGERPVILVLPFAYHGDKADGALIAEGLGVEIVRSLAQLDGLDVMSAVASPANGDLQAFGRQRGANLVLAASMFAWSGQLRVYAQLVRVADNVTVWSDLFEPVSRDVVAIQDQISREVISKLKLRGLGQRRYQLNAALSDAYMTARALQARHQEDDARKAADLFEQITIAEPGYVPAYAGLASALGQLSRATRGPRMPEPDKRMALAARMAVYLDPGLAESHAAMGNVHASERRWEDASESFREAIRLDPTLTDAYTEFVLMVLIPLGEIDEALRVLEAARREDPNSLDVRRELAMAQLLDGRYEDAIENCRWVLERDPGYPWAENSMARALMLSGRTDQALEFIPSRNWEGLGYFYALTNRRREAEALIRANPGAFARHMVIYAGIGERELALDALRRTAEIHWWRAALYMQYPEMRFLRDDPRFDEIQRQIQQRR